MTWKKWVAATAGAAGLAGVALAQVSIEKEWSELNSVMNVTYSEVVSLEVDPTPGISQVVVVPFMGQEYALELSPHSVRDPLYQVLEQQPDGSLVAVEPAPVRTVRGVVLDMEGTLVAGSTLDDGLWASILFDDGSRIWIEPLSHKVDNADPTLHVVYRGEDVLPAEGYCPTDGPSQPPMDGDAGSNGGGTRAQFVAQIGCDTDVEYVNDWGGSTGTQNRVNNIINQVNVQYERDIDVEHLITVIIIRSSEPDPYSSTDPSTLLSQFRNEWLNNQGSVTRDLAHLFTGKNLNGSVIGIAWNIGVICNTSQHYCLSESDCCGSFACATDLTAHECGHLWNGSHCTCSGWTMNPSLTCSNQFHPTLSIPQLVSHRDTRTCLDECSAGTITDQPDSQSVCIGDNVSFTVASNVSSPTYQWRKDGVNLMNGSGVTGVDTPTLQLALVDGNDEGDYDVVITQGGTGCTVTSNIATLTVDFCGTLTTLVRNNTVPTGGADVGSFDRNVTHFTFDLTINTTLIASDWTASEFALDVVEPSAGGLWHASDETNFPPVENLSVPFVSQADTTTKAFDTFVTPPASPFFTMATLAAPGGIISTAHKIRGISGMGAEIPLAWFDTTSTPAGNNFIGARFTFELNGAGDLSTTPGGTLFATIVGRTSTASLPDGDSFSFSIYRTGGNPCPEDLNGDGTVNLDDLSILLVHFGQAGGPADGDINGDGQVDLTDLSALLVVFGSDCP